MLFWAMNLNFYDVMKKIIYFSTIVSLIFPPYSKCVNICYYDEVWFDLLLMMLYKKEKYFWNAIKIQQKIINKNLVHLHGLQASIYKSKDLMRKCMRLPCGTLILHLAIFTSFFIIFFYCYPIDHSNLFLLLYKIWAALDN